MLFKKRFQPNLIDLVEYEKDLLYEREHAITLRPPQTIARLWIGDWTDAEMRAMEDNREKAWALYENIKRTIKNKWSN